MLAKTEARFMEVSLARPASLVRPSRSWSVSVMSLAPRSEDHVDLADHWHAAGTLVSGAKSLQMQ